MSAALKPTPTFDARKATQAERLLYQQARLGERFYAQRLRGLAQRVIKIARDIVVNSGVSLADNPSIIVDLAAILDRYGDAITPWAQSVAERMVKDVALRDARMWAILSRKISWGLREEIAKAPTGKVFRQRMEDQLVLIKSIPQDLARKVHEHAINALATGTRANILADEIMEMANTTRSHAELIARTETSRTATEFTKARAEHVGSPGYIWRTVHDEDVRPSIFLPRKTFIKLNTPSRGSHRLLEGTFHAWDDPPIAGQRGERAHPGCIYRCRCVPEPIIPGMPPLSNESWEWVNKPF